MTAVRRFRPENRLRSQIATPGGVLLSDAVAAADKGLDSISESVLSAVDQKLLAIEALALSGAQGATPDAGDRIYTAANEIFAEAGAFGRAALSEAAHSLCSLLANRDKEIPWAAVTVHVQTMRILRQGHVEASDAMCRAVLDGLRKVSART